MINAYQTSGTSPTKRQSKTKTVTLEANFPELKDRSHASGKGHGSSLRVAFAAAGRNLFSQPKLKRKRFTQFTIVAVVEKVA